MVNRVVCGKTTLAFGLGLLILPACGKSGMGVRTDAAADKAKLDTSPATIEDLAPPLSDLESPSDRPPDTSPSDPVPAPPDLPTDPATDPDRPDVLAREVGGDILGVEVDLIPDARADLPNKPDIPNSDLSSVDTPPAYDQNPAPDELPPKRDVGLDARDPAELCTSSGGTVGTTQCCNGTGDFPDSCLTGGCACSSANSHDVKYCACPSTACFQAGTGCVGPGGVCTVGMDQTCNDSSLISSIHGRCLEGGRCLCNKVALSPTSGKCL